MRLSNNFILSQTASFVLFFIEPDKKKRLSHVHEQSLLETSENDMELRNFHFCAAYTLYINIFFNTEYVSLPLP